MKDNDGARKLTRFTLVATLIVSIIANVTHAIRADSEISLLLRVPGGIIWPVLAFLAIEIIVRTAWESRASHHLARVLILGPAVPALVISYSHQRDLLLMMGETEFVARGGPIAIDGLMVGCTLALLFTRARALPVQATVEVEEAAPPAAHPEQPRMEPRVESFERDARLRRAIESLQAGMTPKEAAAFSGLSESYVRNYAAVVRYLLADPNAEIPEAMAKRVKADVVSSIREWARLESVK